MLNYHENPAILHINCREPHAYMIPYTSESGAIVDKRSENANVKLLNGTWGFRWYPTPAVAFQAIESLHQEQMDSIMVPRSWQTVLNKGYDVPQYTNITYPFPCDPPHLPDENPCGLYVRDFTVSSEFLEKKRLYLVFEGVDSCFYLYVNDTFTAYSQVSHATSEIDVTDKLHEGVNTVKVLVLKWCDGSYLEDQDKWRLSGIFRDVYLLCRDQQHIDDVTITTDIQWEEDTEYAKEAQVTVALSCEGSCDIQYRLISPQQQEVACGTLSNIEKDAFVCQVKDPELWSDESPSLYRLLLVSGSEHLSFLVGIREICSKNRVIYVNRKPIKGKGVNRHDSHPILGASTPYDHMVRDLKIIKSHNINLIRTSHYPNDPRFPSLCDQFGLYLINECDLETHGMIPINRLAEDPVWKEAFVDRAARLYQRDKNHASVLIWSLGNESELGRNHVCMADYIRKRDFRRLIVYEGAKCGEDMLDREHPEATDIEGRMYQSVQTIERFFEDETRTLPYMLCEYSHAMGNGPGGLKEYIDCLYAHEPFFAASVWEFTDQSIATGDVYRDPHYAYGGDFGDQPNDANFCVDGLVYPDRTPHPGMLEVKQAYKPFVLDAIDGESGRFRLKSRRFFTDLSYAMLYWSIEADGVTQRSGVIAELEVEPQGEKILTLPMPECLPGKTYTVTFSLRHKFETRWAKIGDEIGFQQVVLPIKEDLTMLPVETFRPYTIECEEDEFFIRVSVNETIYTFSKQTGLLVSICDNGNHMLCAPLTPTLWRAPTDNDRYVKLDWIENGFDRATVKCYHIARCDKETDRITLQAVLSLGCKGMLPLVNLSVRYTILSSGQLVITSDVTIREDLPMLPRFGWEWKMPYGNEYLRYLGYGPIESYVDKQLSARFGLFESTAFANYEPYLFPQENAAHLGCSFIDITNVSGHGLHISMNGRPFSFNASHYTKEQLTACRHRHELIPEPEITVNVDYQMTGIGSHSCGPDLDQRYRFEEKKFSFTVTLSPFYRGGE